MEFRKATTNDASGRRKFKTKCECGSLCMLDSVSSLQTQANIHENYSETSEIVVESKKERPTMAESTLHELETMPKTAWKSH